MNTKVELDESERRAVRRMTSEEREIVVEQVLEAARDDLEWLVRMAVARALQIDTMEIRLEDVELVGELAPRAPRPRPALVPHPALPSPRPSLPRPRTGTIAKRRLF
jgi:hypothetical protein